MPTNHLTEGITKRDIWILLVITLLIDVVLYFSKYSSFMVNIYDLLTMVAFYAGFKLHRMLKASSSDGEKTPFRKLAAQFAIVFSILYGSVITMDSLSYSLFSSYWNNQEQMVEDYSNYVNSVEEEYSSEDTTSYVFAIIDSVGYEFLASILAGSEEIWRLAYIVLILLLCKKLFRKKWERNEHAIFLGIAITFTSILFGWSHTFTSGNEGLGVLIGTIALYSISGFIFAFLLLWTKNLWLLVLVHSFYDVVVTISWYYFGYAVELSVLILYAIAGIIWLLTKNKQKVDQTTTSLES